MYKSQTLKKIIELGRELQNLKDSLNKKFYVGRLYKRTDIDTDSVYTIVDYNDTIRILNVSHCHFWKKTIKSSRFADRKKSNNKVEYLYAHELAELMGSDGAPENFIEVQAACYGDHNW